MRSLLLGTSTALALWGMAAAIYVVGWMRDESLWRGLGLFTLGSTAILQLQLLWIETRRARVQAGEVRNLLAARHREEGAE